MKNLYASDKAQGQNLVVFSADLMRAGQRGGLQPDNF
jgi:hypothetical protein